MHQQVNSNTILFPLKLHVRYGITIHQWGGTIYREGIV